MTILRDRMLADMQLRGLAEKTQTAYLRTVRQLAAHYGKSPDQIDEEELRQYFLYLKNEKKASRSTCTIAICGIKFFYERTLGREWATFELVRPPKSKKLPVVLSQEEVRRILACVRRFHYRVCLTTIYSCGLRLQECVHLQVADIDGDRLLVHVRQGKGAKDRTVPLAESMLVVLRSQWQRHRHPTLLFPRRPKMGEPWPSVQTPMDGNAVQRAIRVAAVASEIGKAATPHTLRHSWATHMLEAGVNVRLLQRWLGHSSLQTTLRYAHLTRSQESVAEEALERVLEPLAW